MAGAIIKIMPVRALAFSLRQRNVWKGMVSVALGGVAVMLATLGPVGMASECWTWLTRIAPVISAGERWLGTVTLGPTLIPRWMMPDNMSLPNALGLSPAWLAGVSLGVPLLGYVTRHKSVSQQAAIVIAATILAGPVLRINYLPILVPCALVLWQAREPAGRVPTDAAAPAATHGSPRTGSSL